MPRVKSWAPWTKHALTRMSGDVIAIDTETTGLSFYDEPFCATVTWCGDYGIESHYIDLESPGREGRALDLRDIMISFPTWVFHNAKFDLQKLLLAGALTMPELELAVIEDTQTIWTLLDENDRHGLKHLARTILGEETNEEAILRKVRRRLGLKKADGYHYIPRECIIPYALKDTEFTYRLYEEGAPRLKAAGLQPAYDFYMAAMRELLLIEANGIALDLEYLREVTAEYELKVIDGWQRIVDLTGKPDLNPQSPMQLQAAFKERGVSLESTAVEVLRGVDDELAEAILQYRQDKKIHTTYLKGLLDEQVDGVVHPWFNEARARTGRTSSGGAFNN